MLTAATPVAIILIILQNMYNANIQVAIKTISVHK